RRLRRHPLELRDSQHHPGVRPPQNDLRLRQHPSPDARPLRPCRSCHHHHRGARDVLGGLRYAQRCPYHPRARPGRRGTLAQDHQVALRGPVDGDLRMNVTILGWALLVAQVLLGLAMAFSTFRLLRGPRAQDRVASLDSLYANSMLLMIVFGIRTGTTLFFEAALIVAILSFASSSAL